MPPATRLLAFLLVFSALFLFALVLTIVTEFSDVQWVSRIVRIGEGLGRLTFVSIAITFILVEGVPMLATWLRKEMVKEAREQGLEAGRAEGIETGRAEGIETGRAEGREEGLAEERKAWQAWRNELEEWERQKEEADVAGLAFDKPRPPAPDAEQRSRD